MKRAKNLVSDVALLSMMLLIAVVANATVTASLDNNQVATGDTVQLTLEHDGQTNSQPDLAPLKQDFDVLSSSRQSSMQIINGQSSSQTLVVLTLAAKRNGRLTIPAITWDSDQSSPITLTVANAGTSRNSSGDESQPANGKVFIETQIDRHQPYVQAAVAVTVKLYVAERIYQASLNLAPSGDALVQQVGSDQRSNSVRDGQRYDVIARHYLVFPQHSGNVTLPGAELNAQIATRQRLADSLTADPFGDFFGQSAFGNLVNSTKPIRLHGDDIELKVRARPVGATANYWLPAQSVTLTGQWHPDTTQAHVGDPITLDLDLQATGITAEQLPDLSALLTVPDDLKLYPDQAKFKNAAQGDTVVATRTQSIALIADQAGQFTVPAIHVQWWDTKADMAREVELPARTVSILPAVGRASARAIQPSIASSQTQTNSSRATVSPRQAASNQTSISFRGGNNKLWFWASVGLGVAWVATLCAWYMVHRRNRRKERSIATQQTTSAPIRTNTAAERNAFRAACRDNDAVAARRHLLAWASNVWPDDPPVGMQGLAARLENAALTNLLRDLDRAVYGGGKWRGTELSNALNELSAAKEKRKDKDGELAALYP